MYIILVNCQFSNMCTSKSNYHENMLGDKMQSLTAAKINVHVLQIENVGVNKFQ